MTTDTRVIRKVAFESGPVEMSVRLWQFKGIRLMTHEPPEKSHHIIMPGNFRVSEETTGFGVPNTWGQSEEVAEHYARVILELKRKQLPALIAKLPVLNPISK